MEKVEIAVRCIDEDFKHPAVATSGPDLELCLKNVLEINSTGIRIWITWIQTVTGRKITLSECRPALVRQINNISNFLPKGSQIESIYVPFFCTDTDESKEILFVKGKDFDAQKVLRDLEFDDEKGNNWIIDTQPDLYFKFISIYS